MGGRKESTNALRAHHRSQNQGEALVKIQFMGFKSMPCVTKIKHECGTVVLRLSLENPHVEPMSRLLPGSLLSAPCYRGTPVALVFRVQHSSTWLGALGGSRSINGVQWDDAL